MGRVSSNRSAGRRAGGSGDSTGAGDLCFVREVLWGSLERGGSFALSFVLVPFRLSFSSACSERVGATLLLSFLLEVVNFKERLRQGVYWSRAARLVAALHRDKARCGIAPELGAESSFKRLSVVCFLLLCSRAR